MLRYRYRGGDPQHRDNVGFRRAYVRATPLVYFHGIVSGKYQAFGPVFIHYDDPASLTFTVALGPTGASAGFVSDGGRRSPP